MEGREGREKIGSIPSRLLRQIQGFAKQRGIREVILFGSRARGTHRERSDIDLAARGGDFDGFYWDIREKADSLLMFDLVELDAGISEELRKEIERDGLTLYEETG